LFSQEDIVQKLFAETDKELLELRIDICNSLRKVWESQVSKATQKKVANAKLIN